MKRKLQVFISSTYTDLIPERQAAVSAVLKAGHIPAGMELFTAGDRSQMQTITQWIDESDVFMLILGGRYGSVEPTSGLSYTELEFDYAAAASKPMFAVVIKQPALDEKVKVAGAGVLELEHPKELAAFRKKVLGSVSSFFDDIKDIKLCVHESLSDFSMNRALKGWVSADTVTDTKPLVDEIKKLSDENQTLKQTIETLKNRVRPVSENKEQQFEELEKILKATPMTVPAAMAANQKAFEIDLLNLLSQSKTVLVTGVDNRAHSTEAANFYYHTVCPPLAIHGLVANEKIAGVQYRRFAFTALGNAFLAHLDRKRLLKSNSDVDNNVNPISAEEIITPAEKEPSPPKAVRKSAASK